MQVSQMWLENGNWIPEILMDERSIEEAKNPPENEEDLPEPDVIERCPATCDDPVKEFYRDLGGEGG